MNNIIAAQETTGVFERKEKKYVLTRDVLQSFLNSIHSHLVPDERGITRVSSLYYDTPENTLISRSLEKPVYKEKLRIRAYGEVDENSEVFVELKKKFKGIVYKRRFSCTLSEAEAFMTPSHVILRSTKCDEGSSQQGFKTDGMSSLEARPFASRGALTQGDVGCAEGNNCEGLTAVNRSATSDNCKVDDVLSFPNHLVNDSSEVSNCEGLTAVNRSATSGHCKVEKLVGISTELYMGKLCVGIGINVFNPEEALNIDGKNAPVYLEDFCKCNLTLDFVLKTVLLALNAKLEI